MDLNGKFTECGPVELLSVNPILGPTSLPVSQLPSTGSLKFWHYRICLLQILLIHVCMSRCESLQSLWKDFLFSVQQSTANISLLDHCSINIFCQYDWILQSILEGILCLSAKHAFCWTGRFRLAVKEAVLYASISLLLPLVVILFITDAVWSFPCFVVALPLLLLEIASYGNALSEFLYNKELWD